MPDKPAYKAGDRFANAADVPSLLVLEVVQLPGIPQYCYRCAFLVEPGARPGLIWERDLDADALLPTPEARDA